MTYSTSILNWPVFDFENNELGQQGLLLQERKTIIYFYERSYCAQNDILFAVKRVYGIV